MDWTGLQQMWLQTRLISESKTGEAGGVCVHNSGGENCFLSSHFPPGFSICAAQHVKSRADGRTKIKTPLPSKHKRTGASLELASTTSQPLREELGWLGKKLKSYFCVKPGSVPGLQILNLPQRNPSLLLNKR